MGVSRIKATQDRGVRGRQLRLNLPQDDERLTAGRAVKHAASGGIEVIQRRPRRAQRSGGTVKGKSAERSAARLRGIGVAHRPAPPLMDTALPSTQELALRVSALNRAPVPRTGR